jgi:hypothetical protein
MGIYGLGRFGQMYSFIWALGIAVFYAPKIWIVLVNLGCGLLVTMGSESAQSFSLGESCGKGAELVLSVR